MKQMPVEFKKIYEHDMDLLIMEEFLSDRGFAKLFLEKVQLSEDYTVQKAAHSLADSDGESDITLILQYPNERVALLIEDKIDAPTMPEQSQRYKKRAESAISRGEYDRACIMLAAPASYHEEHKNDSNADYENRITYEELQDYLNQRNDSYALFKAAMIGFALEEKKRGYLVQEDPSVTAFWIKLRQFSRIHYPQLTMVGADTPKGASACWPEFRTSLGTIKVIYKSQKGYVDLEFPQYGERTGELRAIIGERMMPSMQIRKTGKSASVSLADDRWVLDFTRDFEACKTTISAVLDAVSCLCQLASTLNYSELY